MQNCSMSQGLKTCFCLSETNHKEVNRDRNMSDTIFLKLKHGASNTKIKGLIIRERVN